MQITFINRKKKNEYGLNRIIRLQNLTLGLISKSLDLRSQQTTYF
jgi:hypothetical protein